MPGRQTYPRRTEQLLLRLTPEEKTRWTTFAGPDRLSALVRSAVAAYLLLHERDRDRRRWLLG